jgi:hypothetical protein
MSTDLEKNSRISHFIKICLVVFELLHLGKETNRHRDTAEKIIYTHFATFCYKSAKYWYMTKTIHTGVGQHTIINMVVDHLLPSIQQQSFLEWIRTSFEQSLAEFFTILLEEHLQVALGGDNLFLTLVFKTDQSGLIMFGFGDCARQGRR